MMERAIVIGAGLAGCEAAWQIAQRGVPVTLHEMKPHAFTPAHHSAGFAELVCSNSLRSDQLTNAVGLLKEEMRQLGSLILKAADATRRPRARALAVDREKFSDYVTQAVRSHPLIEVVLREADELPQTALDYYRDVLLYRIYTNAQKYGTDMNTLLSSGMMGSSYDSVDAYLADANDSIKSITQQALLMQAVAEKTGFKCDTATMNADFGRYYGTTDPSQYVSAYGENYIKMNVLQSDVMQNLIDNVKYE